MASVADSVVAYGMQEIGKPYVWGDEGPNTFDCSGLMEWIYAKVGVKLPRVSQDQQRYATPIAADKARAGDLVFWGSPAHHVGLYLGGGRVLHAPDVGDTVKVSNVWGSPTYGRVPGVGGTAADVVDVAITKPVSWTVDGVKRIAGDVGVVLVVAVGGVALIGLGAWQAVKGSGER